MIEFLLEFIKPVTLAMRLFGNIYGGEVALGVIIALTIAIMPVVMLGLEVLLNFMQALIFSVLTLMFTIIAIERHDDHEEHDDMPEGNIGPPLPEDRRCSLSRPDRPASTPDPINELGRIAGQQGGNDTKWNMIWRRPRRAGRPRPRHRHRHPDRHVDRCHRPQP